MRENTVGVELHPKPRAVGGTEPTGVDSARVRKSRRIVRLGLNSNGQQLAVVARLSESPVSSCSAILAQSGGERPFAVIWWATVVSLFALRKNGVEHNSISW
jgi:hypothetical protein